MTCVLSMTPLYSFDDGYDFQSKYCENSDHLWCNSSDSALKESDGTSSICRLEACSGSTARKSTRADSDSLAKHTSQHSGLPKSVEDSNCQTENTTKRAECQNGSDDATAFTEVNNNDIIEDSEIADEFPRGIKRKSETFDTETILPSKRISAYLNTPKEKKDERKKIIKMSFKKLKHIEDPELFLRRTVLVNNTMKKLQGELREEKRRWRKYGYRRSKSMNKSALNNSCLSNPYLYDDHFLSGVHEKITDDMTETLVHNVLNYKPSDEQAECEVKSTDNVNKEFDTQCGKTDSDKRVGGSLHADRNPTSFLYADDAANVCEVDAPNGTIIVDKEDTCEPMDVILSKGAIMAEEQENGFLQRNDFISRGHSIFSTTEPTCSNTSNVLTNQEQLSPTRNYVHDDFAIDSVLVR